MKAKQEKITKDDVLRWFGDRGVFLNPKWLKKWSWEGQRLWFVINGADDFCEACDTEPGLVDYTYTHRDDGSPILIYELYDSVPMAESPFAKKETKKPKTENPMKAQACKGGPYVVIRVDKQALSVKAFSSSSYMDENRDLSNSYTIQIAALAAIDHQLVALNNALKRFDKKVYLRSMLDTQFGIADVLEETYAFDGGNDPSIEPESLRKQILLGTQEAVPPFELQVVAAKWQGERVLKLVQDMTADASGAVISGMEDSGDSRPCIRARIYDVGWGLKAFGNVMQKLCEEQAKEQLYIRTAWLYNGGGIAWTDEVK